MFYIHTQIHYTHISITKITHTFHPRNVNRPLLQDLITKLHYYLITALRLFLIVDQKILNPLKRNN